ncbi:hypothetical protein FOZ63_015330 [Perkinsus olseni]|uniref:C2 domain-containing protein n=1 Tax=Perkinsus olseni TaxID=32597 RepID=A0A7J6R8V4_PEROL|nr:hypothetical protein FOZ63_015330 [Perkinsus olseni]
MLDAHFIEHCRVIPIERHVKDAGAHPPVKPLQQDPVRRSTPRSIRIAPAGVSAAQTSTAERPPSEVDREEHQSTDGLIKNLDTWIDIKKRVMRHQETGHHQGVENQSSSACKNNDLGDKYRPGKSNATSKNPPMEKTLDDREGVGWSTALLKTWWSSSGSLDEAQPEEDERLPSSAELKPTQNVPSPGDDGGLWGYLSSARDRMVSAARALAAPEDDAPIRPILLREFGGAVEDVVIAVHVKKCTKVPMMDLIGHADCYVTVQIDTTGIARDGDSSGPRSRTIYNESDPVFNEWVETPPLRAVELLSPNAMLRLTVLDWDIVGSDDLVGTCVYPLYETLQCSGMAPYVLSPLNGQSAYSAGEKPSVNLFVKITARATAGAVCVLFTPIAITGLTGFTYRNSTLGLEGKLVKEKRNPVELPQLVS